MKIEDAVLVGGASLAAILALWQFMKAKGGGGEISGEVSGSTSVEVVIH